MAQPQITKTKWGPQMGGLNSDVDPKNISGGDLVVSGVNTGGMNVRALGRGTNVSPDYEPVFGNEYVYTLDPVIAQNKKWRIYVDTSQAPVLIGQLDEVDNGTFLTDLSSWNFAVGTWVWNPGAYAQHIPGPGNGGLFSQGLTGIPTGVYYVQFDIVARTAGSVTFPTNQFSNTVYTTNGTYTVNYPVVVNNDGTGTFNLFFNVTDDFDGGITNISAYKIAEVYAFTPTLQSSTGSDLILVPATSYWPIANNVTLTLSAISDWFLYENLNGFPSHAPSSIQVVTGSYTGYVELEFTDHPYFDYILLEEYIESLSNVTDCVNIVVSQEAIDPSCTGEWNLIGSDDKPGDCFQFWTTRLGLPVDLEILNITNPSPGVVRVETVNPHGLVADQAVLISQVVSLPEVNGIWTVTVVSTTAFDLNNCTWIGPTYTSGGIVTINIYGMGEIGVAVKDNDGVTSYTKLLRSKEFNFSTLKQIDCRAKRKQDTQKYAVYYTDNFNVPRVFYYKGAYQTDGALNYILSENIYEYGNISSESKWIINNEDFYIEVTGQDQAGGQLKSGIWRYSARLLTADFSSTNWSQITEGIPVFKDSTSNENLIGDNPDVVSSKVNRLKLTNNVIGLYTYVEIAALNYFNDIAPQGYIIGRYELSGDQEQFINHTGFESTILNLDTGSLNEFSTAFVRAQNVELLDNRAILSNLTPSQTIDFTEWVKTFKYSLNRRDLTTVGSWSNDGLRVGEYQEPMNVYSYKSHMMMETYRYGFKFKLKNGTNTQVFYPGYDIKIDLPATLPTERLPGTFTTFDLTDQSLGIGGPDYVYSVYINWENINLAYLIDGVPAYDLIDEIVPCRATVIPEVLGHGVAVLGVNGYAWQDSAFAAFRYYGPLGSNSIGPYPYLCGDYTLTSDVYPGTTAGPSPHDFTSEDDAAFFFCGDIQYRQSDITYLAGDKIIPIGCPQREGRKTYPAGAGWRTTSFDNEPSYYAEFYGYTNYSVNPTEIAIDDAKSIDWVSSYGGSSKDKNPNFILIDGRRFCPSLHSSNPGGSTATIDYEKFFNEKHIACSLSSAVSSSSGFTNYGLHRAIYYRSKPGKYGDPSNTKWTEYLNPYRINEEKGLIASGDFNSYGDCFTQKSYMKFRYPGWFDRCWTSRNDGMGCGLSYYGQNRINSQLRTKPDDAWPDSSVIHDLSWQAWVLYGWALSGTLGFTNNANNYAPKGRGLDSQLFYNTGYTPVNNVVSQSTYNPLIEYQTDWGNAIAWSDPESEGSNTDNLRNFPPLNLKFLDYTQGSITDARALNGELVTVQAREVQRQYFDTTAVLTTQNGGEAYLGTGAVLSRRGMTMNKFGSRHKWSVIMGLSDKGHDVMYGIDDINNTVWRIGYDGTNSLDEIQGMKSFFANNLQWIKGKYTPANDEGIRGVANQRYREVIWTLRGRRKFPEWQAEENYCLSFPFESNVGEELLVNGNFNGNLDGWTTFYPPPVLGWFYGAPAPYGSGVPYGFGAASSLTYPFDNYLLQVGGVPFVAGNTYILNINVAFYDPTVTLNGIDIYFQHPFVPPIFTITTPGNYYFSYTAVPGDDNIYIQRHGFTSIIISSISLKESIQTGTNWNGSGDWTIVNNEACTNGLVASSLIQDVADYIIPNYPYVLTFEVTGYVPPVFPAVNDLRVTIGNVTSPPVGITGDGIYTVGVSPTATGVIRFNPNPTFEGCIKGNIKLCTNGVLKVYNTGDIVQTSGYGATHITWSQTPDIWICLKDGVTSNPYFPPDPSDPDWAFVPHTNPNYYTEYTIVYNEIKNKFQSFLTILPRIYAHFLNSYLVPRPISNTGRVYISDSSTPTLWFQEGIDAQTGDAYFDATINSPSGRKRFLAARVEADTAPSSMTVSTVNGSSTTGGGSFEQRENEEFDGYVNDTPAGSIIYGDYGIFRFTFAATTYNRFNSFIASVRERARKWFR